MSENRYRLNIEQVKKFLPHRAPFLLVDRILEIHPSGDPQTATHQEKVGTKTIGIKAVSFNEPFFPGHFPDLSIFPGVLIIETMAQVSSFCMYPYLEKELETFSENFQCILVGVDNARFRRPVIPGDVMRVETVVTRCRGKLWGFHCTVSVDGQIVAEADLMANLMHNSEGISKE